MMKRNININSIRDRYFNIVPFASSGIIFGKNEMNQAVAQDNESNINIIMRQIFLIMKYTRHS